MSARRKLPNRQHIICELDARLDGLCPEEDQILIKAVTAVTLHYQGGVTVYLDGEQAWKDVGLPSVDRLIAGLQEAKKREWLAEVVWSPVQQAIRVSLTMEDG